MTNQSKYKRPQKVQKNVNDNENMRFTEIMTQDSHHKYVFDQIFSFIPKMQA